MGGSRANPNTLMKSNLTALVKEKQITEKIISPKFCNNRIAALGNATQAMIAILIKGPMPMTQCPQAG